MSFKMHKQRSEYKYQFYDEDFYYKTWGSPMPRDLPVLMSLQEKKEYLTQISSHLFSNSSYEKYEKIRKIGQGTFGEVWKAKNKKTHEIVAMKKILTDNDNPGFPPTSIQEIKILKKVQNENIVELKEIVTQCDSGSIQNNHYLVFEFCEYDLAGLLCTENLQFSLAEIKCLIKQLLMGLHYLHTNNMIHRDVKSSNVLVNKEGILKLADFGLSRSISKKRPKPLTNRVVTIWYRPPELLLGDRNYTSKIDIWSAGCIMAEMWTRQPILRGNSEREQLSLIAALCGSINSHSWSDVHRLELYGNIHLQQGVSRKVIEKMSQFVKDENACDLLDKLLTLDPMKRLDANNALDHDFFFNDPIPAQPAVLKKTLLKIGTEKFELFINRRIHGQQPRIMQIPTQQPTRSSFESQYVEMIF